ATGARTTARAAVRPPEAAPEPRERILQAASGAIAAHGFHGMSMRELARAAGMSLSNLYNYFPSKEEILFALQKEAFEVLVTSAEDALRRLDPEAGYPLRAAGATPDARLYVLISHHVAYVAERPDVMRVLVHEAATLPAPRRRAVRRLKERYFRLARGIVEELVGPAWTGDGADPAELDRVTYNLFGMLNWIYGWYDPALHGPPRELARTIHRIALCGVVSQCPFRDLQERLDENLAAMDRRPLLGGASP
ncbi:MAG TPA: TetR/AcrR family transcriptional regulator, partial [Thermoanaerobaculia bacterium]